MSWVYCLVAMRDHTWRTVSLEKCQEGLRLGSGLELGDLKEGSREWRFSLDWVLSENEE